MSAFSLPFVPSDPSVASYKVDFDQVRVGAPVKGEKPFEGPLPAVYVSVHEQAYFADKSGNLWVCAEYTENGDFDWNTAFNVNIAMGAAYGVNVPIQVEAFLMRMCALVWDAINLEFPVAFMAR